MTSAIIIYRTLERKYIGLMLVAESGTYEKVREGIIKRRSEIIWERSGLKEEHLDVARETKGKLVDLLNWGEEVSPARIDRELNPYFE